MSNKKVILISPLFRFKTVFGIQNRKVKGAVFIQSNYNSKKLYSVKSILIHLNFLNIIGWFTDEKEYPRGSHRIEEFFDLYNKEELDMIVCYSNEDVLIYKNSLISLEKSIGKISIPIYCIKDFILIKSDEVIHVE